MTTHFQDRRVAWLNRLVEVELERPGVLSDVSDAGQMAEETAALVPSDRLCAWVDGLSLLCTHGTTFRLVLDAVRKRQRREKRYSENGKNAA